MKEVIFKHVSIKNFLSVGDDTIDIKFEPGIHIITGINKDKEDGKNGVGKSTIADAIFFAVFGSPVRPIKKEGITNWVNKKECSVVVTFNVINDGVTSSFTLLRSLNPSRVQLIKDGEDISRTIGKTSESIYEILGTTQEMFQQSVIMCLNEVEPYLAKTPAVKRKFIEDIFKIEIFGQMTQFIRNDFNETKRLFDSESEKVSDLESNIQLHTRQQQEQIQKKKTRLAELTARKASSQEEIDHLKGKISSATKETSTPGENKEELSQKIADLKLKEKKVSELDKQYTTTIAVNQSTILNLKKKIKELESLSDGICAYCKQPFSESNKQEKKNLISTHQKEIDECEAIVKDTETKTKQAQKVKSEIEDLIDAWVQKCKFIEVKENELNRLMSDLKHQEIWMMQVDKDIENLSRDTDSYESIITELRTRRDTMAAAVDVHKKKLALIETSKFIVSDEGVKNFIVKKMLKLLNGRLNYYLKQLDANCTCSFNEYFDETIVNNRGRECSYFNFSQGERKRIDLSMLFTFMDIRRMQSNIAINIGIYDELLDTSLDTRGIEGTLNILKDRVLNNKEAIYIISHKSEAAKHATGEVIYLEKENDITRRKPYDQSHNAA